VRVFTQAIELALQWHSKRWHRLKVPTSGPVTKLTGLSTRQQGHDRVVPNLMLSDARAAGYPYEESMNFGGVASHRVTPRSKFEAR